MWEKTLKIPNETKHRGNTEQKRDSNSSIQQKIT